MLVTLELKILINPFQSTVPHFKQLGNSGYTCFSLMLSGGIEIEHWLEMGLLML